MKLSVEQVKKLAMEYYGHGGDVIIECYSDEDIASTITCMEDFQRVVSIRTESIAAQEYFSGW